MFDDHFAQWFGSTKKFFWIMFIGVIGIRTTFIICFSPWILGHITIRIFWIRDFARFVKLWCRTSVHRTWRWIWSSKRIKWPWILCFKCLMIIRKPCWYRGTVVCIIYTFDISWDRWCCVHTWTNFRKYVICGCVCWIPIKWCLSWLFTI